jgi:predicted N-acetyltransferase YhbS
MTAATAATATIRPLARTDLDGVVAIDAALESRSRGAYVERRLAAALREPKLHAQFAAVDGAGLAGYILARVLEGEFGRTQPGLRLELVGVRDDVRGCGIGRQLFDALAQWGSRHAMRDIRTSVLWRDRAMLGYLDTLGFELAPQQILDCAVDGGAYRPERDDAIGASEDEGTRREINFSGTAGNDFERLARDTADVRSMTPADLREIARIDRHIVGRDRSAYIGARLDEAMHDSAIRVSLTARRDDVIVGYLMARADLGDYGRPEPVAVIDTLGVDPDYAQRGIGHALMSQLFANLGALRVERVETIVAHRAFDLLGFFYGCGFAPSQRLPLRRSLEAR